MLTLDTRRFYENLIPVRARDYLIEVMKPDVVVEKARSEGRIRILSEFEFFTSMTHLDGCFRYGGEILVFNSVAEPIREDSYS